MNQMHLENTAEHRWSKSHEANAQVIKTSWIKCTLRTQLSITDQNFVNLMHLENPIEHNWSKLHESNAPWEPNWAQMIKTSRIKCTLRTQQSTSDQNLTNQMYKVVQIWPGLSVCKQISLSRSYLNLLVHWEPNRAKVTKTSWIKCTLKIQQSHNQISLLLRNPNCRALNSPLPAYTRKQTDPAHTVHHSYTRSTLNRHPIYAEVSQTVSPLQIFRLKLSMPSHVPLWCYLFCALYHPWFSHRNDIGFKSM
jgi:hypothetical protein